MRGGEGEHGRCGRAPPKPQEQPPRPQGIALLTKLMLEDDLLKTKKCVTPRGPATATKSFRELFFRTCGTERPSP